MDLLKARELARIKAEKEAGKKRGKTSGKAKAAKKGKAGGKKAAKKSVKKPARARATKKPEKPDKKAAAAKPGPKAARARAKKKPAKPDKKAKAAKKTAPAHKTGDDVFMDTAFGEDLPFVPEEETSRESLILDDGTVLSAADFPMDTGEEAQLPEFELEKPESMEPAGKKEKPAEKPGKPAADDGKKGKKEEAAPSKAGKDQPEEGWELREPGGRPFRIEPDWEQGAKWSWDKMATEDEDFFALVTEELYQREFGRPEGVELAEQVELLSFRLSHERYAVRLTSIRQIIRLMPITTVPRAPEYVLGILSLRGTIIPVFDLHRRLNLETAQPTRQSRIVVVAEDKFMAGFIVDQVEQVVRVSDSSIEPPPPTLAGVEAEYIEGIGRSGNQMIILLDLAKLLVPVARAQEIKAGA